jgi:chemotaxis protein CheZ
MDPMESKDQVDLYRDLNVTLTAELAQLAEYINQARKNLQLLGYPLQETAKQIPLASYQLADVIEATEGATHKILSLTEEMLADQSCLAEIIEGLKSMVQDMPVAEKITLLLDKINHTILTDEARLIEIMTTLSLQDIIGQKIKKIIGLIEEVERRILEIIVAFGIKDEGERYPDKDKKLKEWLNTLKETSDAPAIKQDLVDQILLKFGKA